MAKGPRFFWRGVMIVTPVLVLAALGLYSLKQDRLLAEAQARERAQELAEDFAQELLALLQQAPDGSEALRMDLDADGRLVFPPPVNTVPVPAEPGPAATVFRNALLAMQQGKVNEALDSFERVARDYPDAVGETGLPLQPLAQIKWLELARAPELRPQAAAVAQTLGSNAMTRPTLVTPLILERLADPRLHEEWRRHEQVRQIFALARQGLKAPFPRLFWAGEWLLARQAGKDARYICWHANMVEGKRGQGPYAFTAAITSPAQNIVPHPPGSSINRKMVQFAGRLPRYFDYTLELAGKPIVAKEQLRLLVKTGGGKGGGPRWDDTGVGSPPPPYGVASRAEHGVDYVKTAIYLVSPQMLYERQSERALWFGLLIAASAAAAVLAGSSALRAFQRQQRLTELKSDFVSSVSHELRAPIASVRLMAEGLERGNVTEPGKQKEYFRFIVQECRRLGAMIENVLDFSRIEQGRKEYEFEPTDLPKLVEQTVRLMEPYAAERGVKLLAQIDPEVPEVSVDGRAIQQALLNLMDNAIKHSAHGKEVVVQLQCIRQSAEHCRSPGSFASSDTSSECAQPVRISVSDTGSGIPASEHTRIFERFYRCGSELRRETQGIGIGLSIVKHIVDAHSGTVEVVSEPGQGSRFTIVLPRRNGGEKNEH